MPVKPPTEGCLNLKIALLCEREGTTATALAKVAGVSIQSASQYLKTAVPGPYAVKAIADHFQVSIDWLLDDEAPADKSQNPAERLRSYQMSEELARRYLREAERVLTALNELPQVDWVKVIGDALSGNNSEELLHTHGIFDTLCGSKILNGAMYEIKYEISVRQAIRNILREEYSGDGPLMGDPKLDKKIAFLSEENLNKACHEVRQKPIHKWFEIVRQIRLNGWLTNDKLLDQNLRIAMMTAIKNSAEPPDVDDPMILQKLIDEYGLGTEYNPLPE
ncbi:MAG: helix-turn-helix domain-containing protein [Planctomycetota bacterium]